MEIYIMRHGETRWNKEGRIQGSSDIELNDYGVELAVCSAEGFCRDGIVFDRIYTSPLCRAVTTARIISEMDLHPSAGEPFLVDDRLKEMNFGKYEGILLKERVLYDENIVNCFSRPTLFVADETGESYEDLFRRIEDFIEDVLLPLEEDPVVETALVVCHGTVIRAFFHCLFGFSLDEFWTISQPNCSINRIALSDGVFTLLEEKRLYYEEGEQSFRGIL